MVVVSLQETSERSLSEVTVRRAVSEEVGSHQTQTSPSYDLELPSLHNLRKKCLLFLSHCVYGVLLEKPEWNKMVSYLILFKIL